VAEILPKDRRGQILLLLTIAALATGWVLWDGLSISRLSLDGIKANRATRDTLQSQIDSIEAGVRRAKEDVQNGTGQVLDERLARYRANLALMRQLVPSSIEIANLLDDINSRAKMRGATVAASNPQPPESGSPFDTQKYRFTVVGLFDQIGEFLGDISSLPRVVVPYNVNIERATGPTADTTRNRALLSVTFQIRTFVKTVAPAAGARPRAGGGDE